MNRRIALVAAVLLAACGTEKSSDGSGTGPNDPGTGGMGAAPVASLQAGTTSTKVVLKTAKAVYTLIQNYNGDTDTFSPIACTDATVAVDCGTGAGVVCNNLQCAQVSYVDSIFYVRNAAAAQTTFGVPCDGKTYTADIIGGGTPAAGVIPVTEVHSSAPFVMPVGCAAPTIAWTSALPADASSLIPAAVVPEIYVGLGAPYNRFTVSMRYLDYPWSGSTWALTFPSQGAATVYAGPTATFDTPATAAPITFTGKFYLDRTLLLTGEAANSWELTTSTSKTPMGSSGVPLP